MKKITFLFLILLVFISNLNAQKLKSAFENLKNEEYEAAERMFNKATKKRIEVGVAFYGLGVMRYDTASGRKDNMKAFDNFQKAKERLAKLDKKTLEKYKAAYGIKPSDCDSMMRLCALEDIPAIYESFSRYICYDRDTLIHKFVAKYQKIYPDLVNKVTFSRDSLDYKIALYFAQTYWDIKANKTSCIKRLYEIYDDMRPHPYHDSVKPALLTIQQKMYDDAVKSGFPDDMESFRNLFDPEYKEDRRNLYNEYYYTKEFPFTPEPKDTLMAWNIKQFMEDTCECKYEEKNLKKYVKEFAPTQYGFYLLKRLVQPYIAKKDWDNATKLYMTYRELYVNHYKTIDKTIGLLSEPNPPKFKNEQRLPEEINSPIYLKDYAPVITPSMKKLYFVRDMDMRDSRTQEDMYVSEFKDGKWTEAHAIERFATLQRNESAEHIYPDENKMVMFLNGKFYVTEIQEDGNWGAPYPFKSKTDKYGSGGVNAGYWQADAYFTADGQAMLFATRRKAIKSLEIGGLDSAYYDTDIYVSLKEEDGEWGKPFSLGPVINSKGSDRSPRMSPDLKTLYFTSSGHYGLGGYDIYMSKRLNDSSWTEWSEPINLGREINTAYNEIFFHTAFDGKTVFYNKESNENEYAIYTAELPERFRAETTAVLSGIVTDTDGKPLHSNIIWEDMTTGIHLGNLKNDPTTGKFSITLPLGRKYEYFVESDGYFPQSRTFDTRNDNQSVQKYDSISLVSIRKIIDNDLKIALNNIFFDFDKADIKPESMGEIKHVAKFILSNIDLKIMISGHTDNVGSEAHNQPLSQQRADNVKAELIKLGVPENKVFSKGFGSSRPTSDKDAENRRVEFSIISE